MNFLFDPVKFEGKTIKWTHAVRTVTEYPGYYHWHQCMELLFIHEGEGSVIVNQHTYDLRRGMLFMFQPFQLHKIYANVSEDKPYKRTIGFFDPSIVAEGLLPFPLRHSLFVKLWQGRATGPAFDLTEEWERLESVFSSFDRMAQEGKGQSSEEITMLLLQLMGVIHTAHGEKQESSVVITEARPLRYSELIMQWIESHYTEEVSLGQLAEHMHLSKYYVSRVFHEETGSNITDYMTARRIKQACRLLQSSVQSIERIGIEVGYPNVSYFIHIFKKVVGTTPLKYRQRHVGTIS